MKTSALFAVTSALATLSFPAMAQTPKKITQIKAPPVSTWKAGKAATHSAVKDQGNIGFCWANAWASYLESKVLIEKGRSIELSTLFLGRTYMADNYITTLKQMTHGELVPTSSDEILSESGLTILSRYQELAKDPVSLDMTRQFLINKLQEYSSNELEGNTMTEAPTLGIVPVSVYEKPKTMTDSILPSAGAFPPFENHYFSPDNQSTFKDFISNHLLSSADIAKYLADDGMSSMERDFDTDIGNTPITANDSFDFEGKSYTPSSFLETYIGINSSDIIEGVHQMYANVPASMVGKDALPTLKYGRATKEAFNQSVANVQAQLKIGRPVLLSMVVLDDMENNDNQVTTGVFDTAFCKKPGACEKLGGHAVMIVNTMKDASGHVTAFIIQNSWGPQGVDQNGVQTKVRADRGFNIVTLRYLRAALKFRPYAFSYIVI
jgi:hypothetical protein